MKFPVKPLTPFVLLLASAFLFNNALERYRKLREWLLLGDHSGAEFYEVEMFLNLVPALVLLFLAGFLAGRWWLR